MLFWSTFGILGMPCYSPSLSPPITFLEFILVSNSRARFIRAIVALVWLIDKGHAALIQGVQDALSSTQRFRNRYAAASRTSTT